MPPLGQYLPWSERQTSPLLPPKGTDPGPLWLFPCKLEASWEPRWGQDGDRGPLGRHSSARGVHKLGPPGPNLPACTENRVLAPHRCRDAHTPAGAWPVREIPLSTQVRKKLGQSRAHACQCRSACDSDADPCVNCSPPRRGGGCSSESGDESPRPLLVSAFRLSYRRNRIFGTHRRCARFSGPGA
jgi:hypothetical protein